MRRPLWLTGILLCFVLQSWAQPTDIQQIEALLNITFTNIPLGSVNSTGVNMTMLMERINQLAATDPRFANGAFISAIQSLITSDVGVQACPMGTYSDPTSLSCVSCPAGTFSTQDRASSSATCQRCGPGTWSNTTAASSASTCRACPSSTFSQTVGATSIAQCTGCPPNSVAPEGATSASSCVCSSGYYTLTNGSCAACPRGSFCAGGVKSQCPVYSSAPPLSDSVDDCLCIAGFYGLPSSIWAPCTECVPGSYCPEGALSPISCPASSTSPGGASSLQQCTCASGYKQATYQNNQRSYLVPTVSCICNEANPCPTQASCGCDKDTKCGDTCASGTICPFTTLSCPQGYLQLYSDSFYSSSQRQTWIIAPPRATSVTLTFTYFRTSNFDTVTVYACADSLCATGSTQVASIYGSPTTVPPVTVYTPFMRVSWTSGSTASQSKGWKATYSSTTGCTPLQLQIPSTTGGNATQLSDTAQVIVWTGDQIGIQASSMAVALMQGNTVVRTAGNSLYWSPQSAGIYTLVDALKPERNRTFVVLPLAPGTFNVYLDINGAGTSFTLSGDVAGAGNPTIYLSTGDILIMTRLSDGYKVLLYDELTDPAPMSGTGVSGQTTLRVTWDTSTWTPGTYYYTTSPPGSNYGKIVLSQRPAGLTCLLCNTNEYCYNGNAVVCPANSQSPPGSTGIDACACIPGFYTATTDLLAYVNSQTVDTGGRHSCLVTDGGGLTCWGANENGQLGLGFVSTTAPPTAVGIANVTSVAVGDDFTCVLLVTKKVKCWGGNAYGQLGHGQTYASTAATLPSQIPVSSLGTGYLVQQLDCADQACCAVMTANGVKGIKCWGDARLQQAGYVSYEQFYGSTTATSGDSLQWASLGLNEPRFVAVGGAHSCAISIDGILQCWGSNDFGQVGIGSSSSMVSIPTQVLINDAVKTASCYKGVTCAVTTLLQVKCWGQGTNGRLGTGFFSVGATANTMGANLPAVSLGTGAYALDVTVGALQTCALLNNNHVKCWGVVDGMVVGVNPVVTMNEYLPNIDLRSGRTAIQLCGKGQDMCVILSDYTVACWGNNDYRQLGKAIAGARRRNLLSLPPSFRYVKSEDAPARPLAPTWTNRRLLQSGVSTVQTYVSINISNLTVVPLMAYAIPSSGTPVTRVCALCPANHFCTGADAGNFIGTCVADSYSPPQSIAPSACQCVNGFKGVNNNPCTPCNGTQYCYSGSVFQCPLNSASPQYAWALVNCSCNPGYTGENGGTCTPCPPGSYKDTQGPGTCTPCPAGSYSNASALGSAAACLPCPAGYFSAPGSLSCTPCQAGYASPAASAQCSPCTPGQYSVQASSACTLCPPGTYNPSSFGVGAAACLPCVGGKYSTTPGANASSACALCPSGTFSPQNSTACTTCQLNTFSNAGSQTCTPCPANSTTVTVNGGAQCRCLAGFAQVTSASAPGFTCEPCQPGTWAELGNTTCSMCPAGTVQPNYQATSRSACVPCQSGAVSVVGSATCSVCAAAYYAPASASACVQCANGYYAAAGSSICRSCVAGSYAPTPVGTAGQCQTCPVGFYCPGGAQLITCPSGTYASTSGYALASQCLSCPANNYCPTPFLKAQCPAGTGSSIGSTSQLDCSCQQGFQCTYRKVVEAVITLNISYAQFQTAGVQRDFVAAVAAAAKVPTANVFLTNFRPVGGSRRLLGATDDITHVFVGVHGTEVLEELDAQLVAHRLAPSVDHAYYTPHAVIVTPDPH